MAIQEQIAIATTAQRVLVFTTHVVTPNARDYSNIFLWHVDNWRGRTRSNSCLRDSFPRFDWFLAGLIELWLLDARREQHRCEQQGSCQVIRSAWNMK